jgi:hypothetical protein
MSKEPMKKTKKEKELSKIKKQIKIKGRVKMNLLEKLKIWSRKWKEEALFFKEEKLILQEKKQNYQKNNTSRVSIETKI